MKEVRTNGFAKEDSTLIYSYQMKVLVVYATYSGGTRIAATIVEEVLKTDHEVTIKSVHDLDQKEISDYDFTIFGSNSWFEQKEEGQMNSGFHALKEKLQPDCWKGKRFAIYALGDSNLYHNTFCKSADHLEKMVREFGGDAVVPPLKVDRFYFNEEENEKKITVWAEELSRFLKQQQSH